MGSYSAVVYPTISWYRESVNSAVYCGGKISKFAPNFANQMKMFHRMFWIVLMAQIFRETFDFQRHLSTTKGKQPANFFQTAKLLIKHWPSSDKSNVCFLDVSISQVFALYQEGCLITWWMDVLLSTGLFLRNFWEVPRAALTIAPRPRRGVEIS